MYGERGPSWPQCQTLRFVIAEAARALRAWQKQTGQPGLRMHVNLSVGELLEPDIESYIVGQLQRHKSRYVTKTYAR